MVTSYTLAQYKTWTRGRLRGVNVEDALLTEVGNATNREICHAAQWPFMETEFNGTAAINTRVYDLGTSITDLQLTLGLELTDPNNAAVNVKYLPWREFNDLYPDPGALTAARPYVWTLFGDNLYIGPANMDQQYTFRLPYIKEPTELTGDAVVVDTPDAFAEVMITGMLSRAFQAKNKFNQAQVVRQDFDELLIDMKRRLTQRQDGQPLQMGNGRRSVPWADPWGDYDS